MCMVDERDRKGGPGSATKPVWTDHELPGTPVDEPPPRDIGGRYLIQQLIGRGGMASVYLGRDRRLKRPIAIKILRRGIEVQRFEREAVILADLKHEHVAEIYDSGVLEDGRPYFVSEYLDGVNLGRLLAVAPLPWQVVLAIGLQVAAALRAAHERGVIHRDIKPDNIMLLRPARGELRVKLVDFGVARLTTRWDEVAQRDTPPKERRRTQEWLALGTDGYISLAASTGPAMPEADVFALGVTLFKLCTGQHPYEGDLQAVHQRGVAGDLTRVILAAIDVDPGRELGTAEALQLALERVAAAHPAESLDRECRAYLSRVFFRDESASSTSASPAEPTVVPAGDTMPPPPTGLDEALAPFAAHRHAAAPRSHDELRQWAGRVLDGRFELDGVLGDGGSAVVFDAWDMHFRQRAAVKVLVPEQANDAAALQRFEHEARVLMKVRQEHIVAAFDRGTSPEGLHYLALEHLDGAHLGKIRGFAWLHWPVVLEIGAQAARALDALHRAGVVHRDVVPQNLVWVRDPRRPVHIKLIDASHCKLLPAWYDRERRDGTRPRDRLITREGLIFGDRRFRPPEAGVRAPDPREDIFGLGVSLYLLLTGKFPYPAGMPALGQPAVDAVPLADANPAAGVPAELAQLVHDAIQLDPELRPESCEDFFDQWMGAAESLDPNAFHEYVLTGALKLAECPDARRVPDGATFPDWYKMPRAAIPPPQAAAPHAATHVPSVPKPAPETTSAAQRPPPSAAVLHPDADALTAADPAGADAGQLPVSTLAPHKSVRLRAIFFHAAVAAAVAIVVCQPGKEHTAGTAGFSLPTAMPDPATEHLVAVAETRGRGHHLPTQDLASLAPPHTASLPAHAPSDVERLQDALRGGCPELSGSLRLTVRIDDHRPQVLRVNTMPLDVHANPVHRCIHDHLAPVQLSLSTTATQLFSVKL